MRGTGTSPFANSRDRLNVITTAMSTTSRFLPQNGIVRPRTQTALPTRMRSGALNESAQIRIATPKTRRTGDDFIRVFPSRGPRTVTCSCMSACGCGSAAACAASGCIGAFMAAQTMATMRASTFASHASRMESIGRSVDDASPEEYEASHTQFVRQQKEELRHLQGRLARLQSLRPIPFFRSARRMQREDSALQDRIKRLTHEISALES